MLILYRAVWLQLPVSQQAVYRPWPHMWHCGSLLWRLGWIRGCGTLLSCSRWWVVTWMSPGVVTIYSKLLSERYSHNLYSWSWILYKIITNNKSNPAAAPRSNECDGSPQHFAYLRFFLMFFVSPCLEERKLGLQCDSWQQWAAANTAGTQECCCTPLLVNRHQHLRWHRR